MEYIINPKTGRKIMTNGSVWKSLSIEERNQGETIVRKKFRPKVEAKGEAKGESKGESKGEAKVEAKVESKGENEHTQNGSISLEIEHNRKRIAYISNIEKKIQEANERVMLLLLVYNMQ